MRNILKENEQKISRVTEISCEFWRPSLLKNVTLALDFSFHCSLINILKRQPYHFHQKVR